MIYHTYRQFKRVCNIDEVEVGGIVVKTSQTLLKKPKYMEMMNKKYVKDLAVLHCEALYRIYESKGILNEF